MTAMFLIRVYHVNGIVTYCGSREWLAARSASSQYRWMEWMVGYQNIVPKRLDLVEPCQLATAMIYQRRAGHNPRDRNDAIDEIRQSGERIQRRQSQ
jgi:hypothetical protein